MLPPALPIIFSFPDLHGGTNVRNVKGNLKKGPERITSESPGDVFELADADMAAATIG